MRGKYVEMQDSYVNMQHKYVDTQENCNPIIFIKSLKKHIPKIYRPQVTCNMQNAIYS